MIVRIADEKIAVTRDAEAARPAVAEVRRGPGAVEVFAVAVEDLDACRPVHDVDTVLIIDGGGARLDEFARLHAAPAPHEFRLGGGTRTTHDKQDCPRWQQSPASKRMHGSSR